MGDGVGEVGEGLSRVWKGPATRRMRCLLLSVWSCHPVPVSKVPRA